MTIGRNLALAGRVKGGKRSARVVKERLDRELGWQRLVRVLARRSGRTHGRCRGGAKGAAILSKQSGARV